MQYANAGGFSYFRTFLAERYLSAAAVFIRFYVDFH